MQILVVVANTQVRPLRTDEEKGSMWTAVEHGSVGPKPGARALLKDMFFQLVTPLHITAKGNQVNIPELKSGLGGNGG